MTDAEKELRRIWTDMGVTPEEQDRVIEAITVKAQLDPTVAPFRVPREQGSGPATNEEENDEQA